MDENFELFPTKELADVFVQGFKAGLEIADGDSGFAIDAPFQLPTGEWRVNYGYIF
jgi:hypothetical protein